MMYIDQEPLGGNLVNIIKKSASFNNISTPPASASSTPLSIKLSWGGRNNLTKEIVPTAAAVNGEHRSVPNGNGNHHLDIPLPQHFKAIENHLIEALKKPDLNVEAEEEEEAEYELLEVDENTETDDNIAGISEHKQHNNNCKRLEPKEEQQKPPKIKNCIIEQQSTKFNAPPNEQVNETEADEDNCEEFIIRISPVQKTKNVDQQQQQKSLKKPRRPVPAAIPIADLIENTQKRVLNGNLSRPNSRLYAPDDHDDERADDSAYTYSYIQSDLRDGDFVPHDNQMGIDILGGFRNLFNWRSKVNNSNREEIAAGGSAKRKRSLGQSQPEFITAAPHQIKYRKVENNFPKIITRNLEDELDSFTAYQQLIASRQQEQVPELFRNVPHLGFEMSQRADVRAAAPQRRSFFAMPEKKIVRNTTYADYEYSDDDDDDKQTSRLQRTLKSLANSRANSNAAVAMPKVRNIPIQLERPSSSLFLPPYASAANYMDSFRQPTYAEILKQKTKLASAGHILGENGGSSNNSSGDGASTSRFGNVLGKTSHISADTLGSTISKRERAKSDHEKYKQLLETLVPCTQRSASRTQSRNTLQSLEYAKNLKKKSRLDGKEGFLLPTIRAPLSSTINIDDDDDDSSDEVAITGIGAHLKTKPIKKNRHSLLPPATSTVIIDNDDGDDDSDSITEIIDLEGGVNDVQPKRKTANINNVIDLDAKENKSDDLPYVEPVNTFQALSNTRPKLKHDWLETFNMKWERKGQLRTAEMAKTMGLAKNLESESILKDYNLHQRLRDICIVDPDLLIIEDKEPKAEEVPEFPELDRQRIKAAVCGPPDQVLIEKFNLRVTRRDIHTLLDLNWLNDEVINFYMNLLTERSEKKSETHGYPKVYAMNTFFLPRVLSGGHAGVKRWTRKVNIFEKDIIPVPVHVGGVHWCMAIIHLKNRYIRYYDSMGSPNPNALKALEQYLKDESLDKRKQPFDTSGFTIESVRDVPRQQNGSDCGVFSCMFAEYITRNKEITFSQQHMEYFRQKMILEIVQGELLL